MPTSTAVRVAVADGVACVTIDRPQTRNALRAEDKRRLADTLLGLGDDGARAIVVTGAGDRAFCAGTDIKEMAGFTVPDGVAMLQAEARLFDAVLRVPVPVIAAVNGVAFGAGCVLAYCCDLAVAAASARFGQPEVRNGVPAPVQAALLPQVVGLGRARWLLYTGEVLDAEAALRAGLIGEVVPDQALQDRALELARHVAAQPPVGVGLQKHIIGSWIRDPFDAAVASSVYVAATSFASGEPAEAIRRFLERSR
jgi:enoyl-CoA hydratase/carnithine racemase